MKNRVGLFNQANSRFALLFLSLFLVHSPLVWADGDSAFPVKIYGFVLPTITESSSAVESFSQPNAGAYTAAGNPVLAYNPGQARLTFQVAQSRFGFLIGDKNLQGRFEFDLINFTLASPTTASMPRVRRATVQYALNDTDMLLMGQDWDLFSPMTPHTYNFVGHYFESGDLGFMRQQLIWLHTANNFELGAALGLQTANATANDNLIELSNIPTLALRTGYINGQDRLGVSAIATYLLVDRAAGIYLPAYGMTAFFEKMFGDGAFNLRTEVYWGRNLANLGTLSLAFGNASSDVSEAGGWFTGKFKLGEKSAIFGGLGFAGVLNPGSMLASYKFSSGVYSLNSPSTGPGMEKNGTARLGYEYFPLKNVSLFTELAYLNSVHHLLAADIGNYNANPWAVVGQAGMMLTF